MLFGKTERKRSNPILVVTVSVLAVCGAVALADSGKRMMRCVSDKMKGMLRMGNCCEEEC